MRLILPSMIVIVLVMSSISISAKTKIDTIDNWQVYYNRKIIENYPHYPNSPSIIIKKDKIKPNDFLKVQYSNDTPCSDCKTGLYILIKNKKEILVNGKGTRNSLKVSMKEILNKARQYHTNILDFYYYVNIKRNTFIFKLEFE